MTETQPYNFARAHLWRNQINPGTDKKFTNKDLAEIFGYSNESGFRRRYDRDLKKHNMEHEEPVIQFQEPDSPDYSKLTDLEIARTPYGKLRPTMFVSDLDLDDWIDEFITYDYFTQDLEEILKLKEEWRKEYLSKLRDKLWTMDELLALLPRGYGKTESVLALFVKWFLEIRDPLYIVTSSYAHNRNILQRMEAQLRSPAIRRVYGDIIGKASYGREMMTLTYRKDVKYNQFDPPCSLVTWNGAKEGPHPAWIHFEDAMQKEFKNIESNEDIQYKFVKTFDKMRIRRGNRRTKISITGTRYALEDLYAYLMEKQEIPCYHEKALEEDGKWLQCPNYTLQDLKDMKRKDISIFETTMNNNPIPPSGLYFDAKDWIEATNDLSDETGVKYFIILEPARSFHPKADNTAILVIGIHNGFATVIDGFVGKINDDMKLAKVNYFHNTYDPMYVLVEKAFAQIDLKRFQHLRGMVPFRDTTKNAKLMRISAMRPYFSDGLIRVLTGIQPYDILHTEYLSYNEEHSTPFRKDDSIDALAIIIQQFSQYLAKFADTEIDWSKADAFHLRAK